MGRPDRSGASFNEAFERLSHGLTALVQDHIELAKIELRGGMREWTQEALGAGVGLGILLVGFLLAMAAAALLLSRVLPAWVAFLLVGVLDLLVGGALVLVSWRRSRSGQARRVWQEMKEELLRDRALASEIRSELRQPSQLG